MLKFLSQLLIRDKYIRDHHAGQVEGFARRRADHADVLELLLDGRKHRMFTPKHKIVVNLIADHRDAVLHTDISHCSQFFLRKHPARRIMRTAQKEQLHMMLYDFLFKVCKINMIPVILS